MGINLSIVSDTATIRDHPDWDYLRHSGDEKVANYLLKLDDTVIQSETGYYRPAMVRLKDGQFSEKLFEASGFVNCPRWIELISILRNNPDYWLSNE